MEQTRYSDVRPSPIAGRWYPGSKEALSAELQRYLDRVTEVSLSGKLFGLIVPHAGYFYSGQIAAHAFKRICGKSYQRVVVLSPLHAPHRGIILTSGHDAYRTPLGHVPVDRVALSTLSEHLPITPIRDDQEHSLEIELPFLQHCLKGDFSLVPLMLRAQDARQCEQLGSVLTAVFKETLQETLFIASTDLSHFFSAAKAKELDAAMLARIEAPDPAGVMALEDRGEGFACGRAAIATLLYAAMAAGSVRVSILKYGHSGEASGDSSSVVGYGAAAVLI